MAWRAPFSQLLLVMLLMLFSGSQAPSKVEELQRVEGQTLSVRCQYPPLPSWGAYQRKSLCKEVSKYQCIRLISSSKPWILTQASRFTIRDNPSAGFFTVTMFGLRREDSGHYWCRTYHASSDSVSRSTKFYLAVSTAPTKTYPRSPVKVLSTASTSTPCDQVSAQTPSSLGPTGGANKAPEASSGTTAPLQQQNSTLSSSPTASSALVPTLYGLLMAKSVMLASLVVLALRNRHVQHSGGL